MELEREMQVVAVADYIHRTADPAGFPPIIASDLDAPPECVMTRCIHTDFSSIFHECTARACMLCRAASVRFLTGLQSLHGRSTHFVDAWRAAGNHGPGYTHTSDQPLAAQIAAKNHRELDHQRRLDYILLGGPVVYKTFAQVTACRVILDQPGVDGVWATGHFGVLCDIATVPPHASL